MRQVEVQQVIESPGRGTPVTWRCHVESQVPGLGAAPRMLVTPIRRNALRGLARTRF
jgi:hypothetical protein